MRRCLVLPSTCLLALAALILPAWRATALAEQPLPVNFGLISTQSATELEAKWGPILDDLSAHLGRPVQRQYFEDYAGVVWSLRDGTTHVAWTGNKSAIAAVDRAGAEVFAQKRDLQGTGGYRSYLIARAGSGLSSADDVVAHADDLTFGNGDPQSTSGNLVPGYYLFARKGLEPRRLFKRVTQGSHEQNFHAVADGRADVATCASTTFDQVCAAQPEKCATLRVIWQSPEIPNDPLVWRKDLPAPLKARIREFFLEYGVAGSGKPEKVTVEQRRRLAAIGALQFRASDDSQLIPVREIEAFRERARSEAAKGQPTMATIPQ